MGNLLFSPNGRIGSSEMIKGGLILIALGVLLGVEPIVGLPAAFGSIMKLLGFLLIIPWIFIMD